MCRDLRTPTPESCAACLPPLLPVNYWPVKIYLLVRDQLIISPAGRPVAVNVSAIIDLIGFYQVDDPEECLERVVKLARHFIQEMNDEAEEAGA